MNESGPSRKRAPPPLRPRGRGRAAEGCAAGEGVAKGVAAAGITVTRRQALGLGAAALAAPWAARSTAAAADPPWRHALTLLDAPKYPRGFARYDFVDPDAPKGGVLRVGLVGTFDNLNIAVPRGVLADVVHHVYEQLFTDSYDEVATAYGQIAEAARFPDDIAWVAFRLDPAARWHDGVPITPQDVVFSFEALKALSPYRALHYREVTGAAVTGAREVTFRFARPNLRELPHLVAQMIVLPRHYWRAADKTGGKLRDIEKTTLEPPLGSGPYRLAEVVPGRSIALQRVADHWAGRHPTNVGRHNFEEIRIDYYRDDVAAFEAFRAGKLDWRSEEQLKAWATAYDFPAVKEGQVVREEFPVRRYALMHALVFNLRRERFADQAVREAFDLVLDYEDIDRTLMYGATVRADSYWAGSELACSGLPEGRERELLERLGAEAPTEALTAVYRNPVNGSPPAVRANLKRAARLLKRAGWVVREQRLVHVSTGEPFEVEILLGGSRFERQMLVYKTALERLGMAASLRIVDGAQYANRLRERDFDAVVHVFGLSLVPGQEQHDLWGSEAAERPGSSNLAGIKDPAVDALVEAVAGASSRAELVAATRALDRVLLARRYAVPLWRFDRERTARWNRFGRPPALPPFGGSAFPSFWWSTADADGETESAQTPARDGDIALGGRR